MTDHSEVGRCSGSREKVLEGYNASGIEKNLSRKRKNMMEVITTNNAFEAKDSNESIESGANRSESVFKPDSKNQYTKYMDEYKFENSEQSGESEGSILESAVLHDDADTSSNSEESDTNAPSSNDTSESEPTFTSHPKMMRNSVKCSFKLQSIPAPRPKRQRTNPKGEVANGINVLKEVVQSWIPSDTEDDVIANRQTANKKVSLRNPYILDEAEDLSNAGCSSDSSFLNDSERDSDSSWIVTEDGPGDNKTVSHGKRSAFTAGFVAFEETDKCVTDGSQSESSSETDLTNKSSKEKLPQKKRKRIRMILSDEEDN